MGFGFSCSFSSKTNQMSPHFWDLPRFHPKPPQCHQNNFRLRRWKTFKSSDTPRKGGNRQCGMFHTKCECDQHKSKMSECHTSPLYVVWSDSDRKGGFSQLLEMYLLAASYVPGTVSDIRDTTASETESISLLRGLVIPQLLLPCWNSSLEW